MRTLLRNISNGLYFQGPDRWTNDPTEALDFRMIDRALEFVDKWRLKDVELAFAFNDWGAVTRVPLDRIATPYSES